MDILKVEGKTAIISLKNLENGHALIPIIVHLREANSLGFIVPKSFKIFDVPIGN